MSKKYTKVILAVATSIFYIVLERIGTSIYFTIALAVVSASLYSWAIWE